MCTLRNLETCLTKHSSIFSYWAYSVTDIEAYKSLKLVILHQIVWFARIVKNFNLLI